MDVFDGAVMLCCKCVYKSEHDQCRRNAPLSLNVLEEEDYFAAWPRVAPTLDSCGEFVEKSSKPNLELLNQAAGDFFSADARISNSLTAYGASCAIHTLEDVLSSEPKDLLKIPNIGWASIRKIKQFVASGGFEFSDPNAWAKH